MAPLDEPVHIQPAKAPLSAHGARRRLLPSSGIGASRRVLGFGFALLVLGAIAGYVFLYLPDRLDAPAPIAGTPPAPDAKPVPRARPSPDIVAPFEAAELARAREQANATLAEFAALELKLDQEMNIDAWGAADLARIKDGAAKGDQMFREGQFQAALDEYAAAKVALAELAERGNALFDAALAAGRDALVRLDHAEAVASFGQALEIRPGNVDATAGAERASRLPAILELLREHDRAILRGEYATAADILGRVRTLDPATAGLDEKISSVAAKQSEERRKALLSEGFTALERDDYEAARTAFDDVLARNPTDADALAGIQQTEQAELLAEVDRLRQTGRRQKEQGLWSEALATYDAALAIDPNLRFARDGKERIATRVALIDAMARFIDDPGLLSADDEFAAAKTALDRASAEVDAGSAFDAQVARLRTIVETGSVPVPLVIVSDNATEIVIHKVGVIGAVVRSELMLRPGRYVIVGSRDGCRDVRKEIILDRDSEPVDVRCSERI